MKIYKIAILLLLPTVLYGQITLSKSAILNRKAADSLVRTMLHDKVKDKQYVIFSSGGTNYIIGIDQGKSYLEYYIKRNTNGLASVKSKIIKKKDSIQCKMFNRHLYKAGYITLESDFYKEGYEVSSGNTTYFVMKDIKGERFGESALTVFIKPNPIDAGIYLYFVDRLLFYARKYG